MVITDSKQDKADICHLKPKKLFGARHVQGVMLFLAMSLAFAMRVNMSVAIVAMTTPLDNGVVTFPWSVQVQSVILSSFFWGYVMLQIPGGILAGKFGGKVLIQMSMGVNGLVTLLIPTAAKYGSWEFVCACRVIQGLFQGFLYPSCHNLIGQWVPLEEKGRISSLIYAGCQFGNAMQFVVSGYVSASPIGWPLVFYSVGALSILWTLVYSFVGSSSPELSRMISEEERIYIQSSLGQIGGAKFVYLGCKFAADGRYESDIEARVNAGNKVNGALGGLVSGGGMSREAMLAMHEAVLVPTLMYGSESWKQATPWKSILTSLPFWALVVAHCGQNWGYWTLITESPSYFSNVLNVDIKSNGLITALPYLAMYIISFPFGIISDMAINKNWCTISTVRKISNTIAHWGPAIALIGLSYSPAGNVVAAVLFLTITVGLNAGQFTGYLLVHIDMAPNFAGALMGVTNCLANIVSLIAPLTVGLILKDEKSQAEWRTVFFIAAGVYFFCNLFFIIFGNSKRQAYNETKESLSPEINEQQRNSVVAATTRV